MGAGKLPIQARGKMTASSSGGALDDSEQDRPPPMPSGANTPPEAWSMLVGGSAAG
jgi:hypothetical protein